ncbi:MAG: hypothetical protein ABI340_07795 [Nitrososphaera sp.]|jgi:hypothetical protein
MARIKIKYGQNELEIESKDFYIDNESVDKVICNLASFVKDTSSNTLQYEYSSFTPEAKPVNNPLHVLEEAEIHEPEFVKPSYISKNELPEKIQVLIRDSFFEQSRTVSEVVSQLREYGWTAVPLDVSKVLTKMAFNNELQRDLKEKRSYYSAIKLLEVN